MQDPAGGEVAHTTFAAAAVARWIVTHHAHVPVASCHLLRRGFGDAYDVRLADGQRWIARLGARRPRGAPNIAYEAALLRHLLACGIGVAEPVPTRSGEDAAVIQAPEGERSLFVTRWIDGELPGDNLADLEATGAGLARMHAAARSYAGPPSRYRLDVGYLVDAQLERLLRLPDLDPSLASAFGEEAARLRDHVQSAELTRVACHGDCHGDNNLMRVAADGTRQPWYFDFDDAGPGWLAYDLAVFRWSSLTRKGLTDADEGVTARWQHFLAGYRSVADVPAADLACIGAFQAVRHFWLLGEYAGRMGHWGAHTLAPAWLSKQPARMASWRELALVA